MSAGTLFVIGLSAVAVLIALIIWYEIRTARPRNGPPKNRRKSILTSRVFGHEGDANNRAWTVPSDPKDYSKAMMPETAKIREPK